MLANRFVFKIDNKEWVIEVQVLKKKTKSKSYEGGGIHNLRKNKLKKYFADPLKKKREIIQQVELQKFKIKEKNSIFEQKGR